jgi:hypothetical protein
VDEADGIMLGIVGAEAVRADQLGQRIGMMSGGRLPRAAHLGEPNPDPRLGQLPGGFGAGKTAADDVDLERHGGAIAASRPPGKARLSPNKPKAGRSPRSRPRWRSGRSRRPAR